MSPETLASLLAARDAGHAVVLATRLRDGAQYLLPGGEAPSALREVAGRALAQATSGMAEVGGERWFLAAHAPPHRLLIVGAVHIAQALAPLALATGFAVTIIDPRGSFASSERFPAFALNHAWPDEALLALAPDSRTAVLTLTHDAKLDDPALDRALRTDAFYIGALGSRRTHAARLQRLAAIGHSPDSLARVAGPAGFPIGALTAPEIALSMLAEIVAVRRGAKIADRSLPVPSQAA